MSQLELHQGAAPHGRAFRLALKLVADVQAAMASLRRTLHRCRVLSDLIYPSANSLEGFNN